MLKKIISGTSQSLYKNISTFLIWGIAYSRFFAYLCIVNLKQETNMEMTFSTNYSLMENIANSIKEIAKKHNIKTFLPEFGNQTIYKIKNGEVYFLQGIRIFTISSPDANSLFRIKATYQDLCDFEDYLKTCYEIAFDYEGKCISCYLVPDSNCKDILRGNFEGKNGTWYHLLFNTKTRESLVYCNAIIGGEREYTQTHFVLKELKSLA